MGGTVQSSSSGAQPPQERRRSPPGAGGPPTHSTPNRNLDATVNVKVEPTSGKPLVPVSPRDAPFPEEELLLLKGKEERSATDNRIRLHASDVTEKNLPAIVEFANKQLEPRTEAGPSRAKHHHNRSKVPAPTRLAPFVSVESASVVSAMASTSVVSTANAAPMAASEGGSSTGHLVSDEWVREAMRGAADESGFRRVKAELEESARRVQAELQQLTEMWRSSSSKRLGTYDAERRDLMQQLVGGGALE